jgi:hypothetical protein
MFARVTWRSVIAMVAAGALLAACGGGARQDASEPSANFPVQVTSATFPTSQTLSQHAKMSITIRNAGSKTIPNIAVTVCNVTCRYPAPRGEGTSSASFASSLNETYIANPSRPNWIVDRPPGSCTGRSGYSCLSGGAGGAATASANTWALGRLGPGKTVTFTWGVTAVNAGTHIVAWQVAAGLHGKAKAVNAGSGGPPHGEFTVTISQKPAQSYVNNNGQIVTTAAGG